MIAFEIASGFVFRHLIACQKIAINFMVSGKYKNIFQLWKHTDW